MSPGGEDEAGTPASGTDAPVGSRWPELLMALLTMSAGIVVIVDALRVGTGWDEFDGPRAGYFPFYVGCLLLTASAWTALRQLLAWRRADPAFATRGELASVWLMLWPLAAYVAAVQGLGIYVASALLIGWFMRRHGRYAWTRVVAVVAGVPLVFFVVFERWFLVALPKGPLEAWLGL
jgi:hypothetical protein